MSVYISGVGLCAPGLPDWPTGRAVLAGLQPYSRDAAPRFDRVHLPRNEARRATLTVRLALQAADEALATAGLDAGCCAAVFACAGGNTEALDALCQALIQPERALSPGQFNHSTHNAPLGYWSIASGSMRPAVSVGAFDASFAAGLLEAFGLARLENRPVLLVAYDTPPPPALQPFRAVAVAFGLALLLTPDPRPGSIARLRNLRIRSGAAEPLPAGELERLRLANPAARGLPLLRRLARDRAGAVALPYLPDSRLELEVEPC
ncbi:MAG TPA: beta-ketoacyl synthase chain length factor [Candidatus Competibacter sp.]|nr:3-oxoacyl-ACP synthase [Candidatus Competibacteraceae bacterium]HRC70906.1 beta-ketoacyl synthase chain length factor [Candidatus Competibacter sp.]